MTDGEEQEFELQCKVVEEIRFNSLRSLTTLYTFVNEQDASPDLGIADNLFTYYILLQYFYFLTLRLQFLMRRPLLCSPDPIGRSPHPISALSER